MSDSNASSGGIGICGVLALIFITLKLTEVGVVAEWSWLWVLSPFWIPAAIALIFVLLNLVVDLLYFAVDPRLRIERQAGAD
jgi:MFS family permease